MSEDKEQNPFNLNWVKDRLASLWGKDYWRSLEQIAETDLFKQYVQNEFPDQARAYPDPVSRREFLKLMGASLMLAGLGGCSRQPLEKIVPYVKMPEEIVPGKPLFFATAMPFGSSAYGILVESHMGRPTRIQGNPEHPASLGAADIFAQASILGLYDPDRSQVVKQMGRISTWGAFLSAILPALEAARQKKGEGLRILTGTVNSPALHQQIQSLIAEMPLVKWHHYEPLGADSLREGTKLAFGESLQPVYQLEPADVILSLDSDFLNSEPGSLKYAREFSKRRQVRENKTGMNRLYTVESFPTVTGTMADHKLTLRASEVESFAWVLAKQMGLDAPDTAQNSVAKHGRWIQALVRDLKNHAGKCLVVAGEFQSPAVHAIAHAMNVLLNNVGKTVIYVQPNDRHPESQQESLVQLVKDLNADKVETLLILDANPIFDAPADFGFKNSFLRVKRRVHLGLYEDETAELCHWHIPQAHYLESWSDARSFDGTVSFLQPLIEPLYGGKTAHEILSVFQGKPGVSSEDTVKNFWKTQVSGLDFDALWRKTLHDGFLQGSAAKPKTVSLKKIPSSLYPGHKSGMEIIFRPDPSLWDGRFANNAWLQELPKPITKTVWDNAVYMAPATAEKLSLKNEDLVELRLNGKSAQGPVWILPAHPEDSVTVHVGYGRTKSGKVGTGTGFNAYAIRGSASRNSGTGLEIIKTGKKYPVSCTQDHQSMEGRDLIRSGTIGEYQKDPHFAEKHHAHHEEISLYPPHKYEGYAWGMAIDLNACNGCSSCVIACQSENNIPVVGKDEVARGREMHWIRIDRYFKGSLETPEIAHQPVLCMHCENAPCEPVCPVGATTHSAEGLNEMTYNRCVGTKYCSNNCPYKVRRFNFFEYADTNSETLKMLHNPDVTVRSRGVMEKCTYCVQRINKARIESKKENRSIRDGEVVTACQSACPSEAIMFGDINDPESKVSKLKAQPLNYGILTELNTKPRTSYLVKIKNPNPEIETLTHGL